MNIVITKPDFFLGEAGRIVQLLSRDDVDLVHIRKPHADREAVMQLLQQLPAETYGRLVLHDHFPLAEAFGLYGIHLNSRNPEPLKGWRGAISRSCHSIEE